MRRWAALLGCILSGSIAGTASGEELSTPRFHAGAQVGGGFGNAGPTWVGGLAVEGRLGARLTEWLALDATVMLENCLFCGRSNVGAILELAPGKVFSLGLGGGVGGLYVLHFGVSASTASYGFGVLRTAFRFDRDRTGVLSVGAEGNIGSTYAGTIAGITNNGQSGFEHPLPLGTLVGGARAFFAFETN